jgi:hypothetical protein
MLKQALDRRLAAAHDADRAEALMRRHLEHMTRNSWMSRGRQG